MRIMIAEDSLISWGKAPGQTEQTKCDNAVNAIRKAKDASKLLVSRNIRVFAQGSYCNRTNVRQDSDVDVCVLCTDSFFYELPAGTTNEDFNFTTPASYPYYQLKNDVGAALTSYFVNGHVVRGNKAFDIKENTYRIAADAVACNGYRHYFPNGTFLEGVAFLPDKGDLVINWPDQNYENGVAKNTATGQRFKDVVRILKTLRYKMQDENYGSAKAVPSFLIECLVWNVPDPTFQYPTYKQVVRNTLAHLFNCTLSFEGCGDWPEINGRKNLFWVGQPWTFKHAHAFVSEAWDYLGCE
jgi:hypothetical protein